MAEKPEADVYVGLMFVAVAALTTACIFLAIELSRYEWTLP